MGVGGQPHSSAVLPRERTAAHCIGSWVVPGTFWAGAENLALTRIGSPDRSVHSESIHRLCYCCPQPGYIMWPMQIYFAVINKRRKPVMLLLSCVCSETAQNIAFDIQASVRSMEVADRSVNLVTRLHILYNLAWYRDLTKISYVWWYYF